MEALTYFGYLPKEVLHHHVLPLVDDLSRLILRHVYHHENIPRTYVLLLETLRVNNLRQFQWLETLGITLPDIVTLPLANVTDPAFLEYLVAKYRHQLTSNLHKASNEVTGDNRALIPIISQLIGLVNFVNSSPGVFPIVLAIGQEHPEILYECSTLYKLIVKRTDNADYAKYMIEQGIEFNTADMDSAMSRGAFNVARLLCQKLMTDADWDFMCSRYNVLHLSSKGYLLTASSVIISQAFRAALNHDITLAEFIYTHRKADISATPVTCSSLVAIEWLAERGFALDTKHILRGWCYNAEEDYKIVIWLAEHNYNIDDAFTRYIGQSYFTRYCHKLFESGVVPSSNVHLSTSICQSQYEIADSVTILECLWQRGDRPKADVLSNWPVNIVIKGDILRWLLKKEYHMPKNFYAQLLHGTFDIVVIAIEHGCYYNNNVWPDKLNVVEEAWLTINSYKLYETRMIRGREDQYRQNIT